MDSQQNNCRHFPAYLYTCQVLSCVCCVETESTHKGLEQFETQTNNVAFCVCLLLVSTASLFWGQTLSFLLTCFLKSQSNSAIYFQKKKKSLLRQRKQANSQSRKIKIVNPLNCCFRTIFLSIPMFCQNWEVLWHYLLM